MDTRVTVTYEPERSNPVFDRLPYHELVELELLRRDMRLSQTDTPEPWVWEFKVLDENREPDEARAMLRDLARARGWKVSTTEGWD